MSALTTEPNFNPLQRKAGDSISQILATTLFDFNPLQRKAGDGNSIQTTTLLITIFYTKHPILHLHPLIPLPKQIINHSFISANPSIYLCSLTFRTTLYCFIITPSLQLFQKHFLLFPPQRILGSLTAEQKKNTCRPHKACIFLSNFIHLVVAIYGYI